jgi:CarD family transcriptional regulator
MRRSEPARACAFRIGEYAVYPSHGLGVVRGIEQCIRGTHTLQLIIGFDDIGMTLRLPMAKIGATGLRKISSPAMMKKALDVVAGPRGNQSPVWPRALNLYEAKLNSGDPIQIAELVRDLHCEPPKVQNDRSQRTFYDRGMDRLATELAAVEGTMREIAVNKITRLVIGYPNPDR